jgi:hypothetical protein
LDGLVELSPEAANIALGSQDHSRHLNGAYTFQAQAKRRHAADDQSEGRAGVSGLSENAEHNHGRVLAVAVSD